MNNNLYLMDLTNLIYRFHFAFMRAPLRNSKGENTSSIYGVVNFILDIIEHYNVKYIIAAKDLKEKTFRHNMFEQYKAEREEIPDELLKQIPYIEEFINALNIDIVSQKGYEADDIIGTIKQKEKDNFDKIFIITSDKDMAQLLDEKTFILYPKKGKHTYPVFDIKAIEENLNIPFDRIIDYYALIGDKVDGIPGIRGIGPKTAIKILKCVNSIIDENEINNKIENQKMKQTLLLEINNLKLYKELLKIKCNIDLNYNVKAFDLNSINREKIEELIDKFELYSLRDKLKFEYKTIDLKIDLKNIDDINSVIKNKNIIIITFKNKDYICSENGYMEIGNKEIEIINKLKDKVILIDELKSKIYDCDFINNNEVFDIQLLSDIEQKKLSIEKIILKYAYINNVSDELHSILNGLIKAFENFILYIRKSNNYNVYKNIELPIIPVIRKMEKNGIKVDRDFFNKIKEEYINEIKEIEKQIYKIAGIEFNLNSPKQLQEVLFNKLGIEPIKKIKTGFSTDSSVLELLKEVHPIAKSVLIHREKSKLLNSFIEPILRLSEKDGFIHTTLEQSYTATGRFASKNPNMQNVPPLIRKGFIPVDNKHKFLSIDYSQIELRILAYLSKDENLLKAFENDRDIHNETAMKIFEISEEFINENMRKIAKIINFSIIYGKTPYGLSRELNIPLKKAREFIDKYFKDFSGVKKWIQDNIEISKQRGYTQTLFGRIRYIPEIQSQNKTIRIHGERIATNTPIQGTAADIMKIAIKRVYDYIENNKYDIKILLTIHDELLFEIHKDITDKHIEHIKSIMTDIKPLNKLLKVKTGIGNNWLECKK